MVRRQNLKVMPRVTIRQNYFIYSNVAKILELSSFSAKFQHRLQTDQLETMITSHKKRSSSLEF